MTTLDLTVFDNCVNFVLCSMLFTVLFYILVELSVRGFLYLIERLELRRFKAKVKTKFNMSDFNIKPCPFCGCEHIKVINKDFFKFESFALKCAACDMGTPYGAPTYIVSSWNNRATDTTFSTATADDINN